MEIIGQRFNKFVVLSFSHNIRQHKFYNCLCDCSKEFVAYRYNIMNSKTKSCGCLRISNPACFEKTHGKTKSATHNIWCGIRKRCNNPNAINYYLYGGRGIKIDPRWDKFENFLKDMGERPTGKSLDRINVNGNYSKDNCRWATKTEQANNTRSNRIVVCDGESMTLANFCRKYKVDYFKTSLRLRRGWSIDRCKS